MSVTSAIRAFTTNVSALGKHVFGNQSNGQRDQSRDVPEPGQNPELNQSVTQRRRWRQPVAIEPPAAFEDAEAPHYR